MLHYNTHTLSASLKNITMAAVKTSSLKAQNPLTASEHGSIPCDQLHTPAHELNCTLLSSYRLDRVPEYTLTTIFIGLEICAVGQQALCYSWNSFVEDSPRYIGHYSVHIHKLVSCLHFLYEPMPVLRSFQMHFVRLSDDCISYNRSSSGNDLIV